MDLVERHKRHATEKRASLAVVAKQLLAEKEFSLKIPVAIDCDGTVEAAPVGALGGYLKASASLSSPLLKKFLQFREDLGSDGAWEKLANDPEDGEEFCAVWDACQEELGQGVVCSVDDLVAFIGASKEGFNNPYRQLLVVLQQGTSLSTYKVEAKSLLL